MKTMLALAVAAAALAAAPAALGSPPPANAQVSAGVRPVSEHSPSQNRVDRLNDTGYQIVTEHSPSQNVVDRLNALPTGSQPGDGFQWDDAGIGASAALGGMLLLFGSSLVVLRRKGRLAF